MSSKNFKSFKRSILHVQVMLLINFVLIAPISAQSACDQKLPRLQRDFDKGLYIEVIDELETCLNKNRFSESNTITANAYLARAYIAEDYPSSQVNATIMVLLGLNLEYAPDPAANPRFKARVEELRKEIRKAQEAKSKNYTWYYIGGGILIGGIAAILLSPKEENPGPKDLPGPPGFAGQ